MKFRTGFVSNSSSCSFVIVGVECNDEQERDVIRKIYNVKELPDDWEDEFDDIFDKLEDRGYYIIYSDDQKPIFGIQLASSGDDAMLDNKVYNNDSLQGIIKKVSDFTGRTDIKLYMGTRGC